MRFTHLIKTFVVLSLGIAALLPTACKRHTIIPDDELALIFHDAFLVNAYTNREAKRDSLKLYEPIFARYGYTTADVQYTIGNFSKRKSARLGDVVEQAIVLLEREGKYYNREVAILDTVDRVAERTMTRRVYADSLVRVRSLKDTTHLRVAIDAAPGTYNISLRYRVDSLDCNDRLRGQVWLERHDSTRTNVQTATMWRNRDEQFKRTVRADSTHRRLHVDFVLFDGTPRQPSVTVRDFRIDYTPETAAAVDSLYLRQLNLRIFADDFLLNGKGPTAGAEKGEGSETLPTEK
ncbi:MAG: DUF4296 domain-containing protein [Alistipes senegalensis]|nr:DUF4296 domain-containing protein [Bacteroides cellulosilyticus]MCM1351953.1 DUF4296 domain-containing protein [Alistipes senegalensis]